MAIQEQINRINGEVSAQTSLISQIATALEGKAAGGSGDSGSGTAVETCTVTIQPFGWDPDSEKIYSVSATRFVNGSRVEFYYKSSDDAGTHTTITIPNVECGSIIHITGSLYSSFTPYVEIEGSARLVNVGYINYSRVLDMIIAAPTVGGEESTVSFSYEP